MPTAVTITVRPGIPCPPGSPKGHADASASDTAKHLGLTDLQAFSPQGTTRLAGEWTITFVLLPADAHREAEVRAALAERWRAVATG